MRRHIVFTHLGSPPVTGGVSGTPPPPVTGFFYDTRTTLATSPQVLMAGQSYSVTIDGTYSLWNLALPVGTPEPDATYPTTGAPRVSTQVGLDAETLFAQPPRRGLTAGHWNRLQLNTGSGFAHVEPVGGPYSHPVAGHSYRYIVKGEGKPLQVRITDSTYTDNYGKLRITIS